MNWLNVLGIAVALAMDAFAVAVASGLNLPAVTPRHTFRLAFHFGLFQFLMPVLGWSAGSQAARYLTDYDHWLAMGLLALVGSKMLFEAFWPKPPEMRADPTRGMTLIALSVATSLDALAVGLSMGLLGVSIWAPSVVIGLVAAALTAVGILCGARLGSRWNRWAEAAGGLVLWAIGLHTLWSHLAG